jgi:hypothetical protein
MCAQPAEGRHQLVAVNDTLAPVAGHAQVREADSGQVLFDGELRVESNGIATLGSLPAAPRPAMWQITWQLPGEAPHHNHYLAGPRPFVLADYRRWIELKRG